MKVQFTNLVVLLGIERDTEGRAKIQKRSVSLLWAGALGEALLSKPLIDQGALGSPKGSLVCETEYIEPLDLSYGLPAGVLNGL